MSESPDHDRLHHDALQRELEAARERRDSYQALLKDLPDIFEGRFRDRLRPLQQRNEQLLVEGATLREQLRRSLPQGRAKPAESPPAAAEPMAPAPSGQGDPGHSPLATTARGADSQSPSPPAIDRPLAPWHPGPPVPGGRQRPQTQTAAGLQRLGLGSRPWLLPAGVALALAGAVLGLQGLPKRGGVISSPAPATSTGRTNPPPLVAPTGKAGGPANGAGAAAERQGGEVKAGTVRLDSREPSWLEVEARDGTSLYFGLLEGNQSFPVGEGLRVRAGRPDLIRISWPGGSERVMGSVEDLNWQEIRTESGAG